MMANLATKYDFKAVEKDRYQIWLKQENFKSGDLTKKPFCIVIPPPNVTGKLHLGHAWDGTLQDIIIRRKRMQGYDALFLPGMDHAGIATQAKIEERLREKGISRYDLGREAFLDIAWDWKREYANHIKKQWEALGLSVDYTKERFTLDEKLNHAVNTVFIELYKKGLIYRGNRIINWDIEAKTALSNIEVEHVETEGKLYYFKYPFVHDEGFMIIATTRPETMFGDVALMVHPEDERYLQYVGKTVFIPGTKVEIPIITDDYVDMSFGSGVVKVTPAHDANDFEVGRRHQLEMPHCMNEDGTMNQLAFQYEGMKRFDCRDLLVKDLESVGLVERIEKYTHSVGYSERTGVIVEPRLSLQWFIDMKPLALEALKTKTEFYPARFKKVFANWMHDIQDWCISRQLWWGHRIPAWYKDDEVLVQVECPGDGYIQDEDVLDTWFSSALWPFSTLGWPLDTEDLKRYYPTNVLVTGYDIIFFWVARMIFQGRAFTEKDPFHDVLIHGLIRDKNGKKMSKSLGNGVDPMDVINTYGVDALRYFLATNSAPGADMRYEEEKVESSWNFINKLWNITRFITLNVDFNDSEVHQFDFENDQLQMSLADHYIISRLNQVIEEADHNYEKYEFGEASRSLYNFIWDEFASWYVEYSKIALSKDKSKLITQKILLKVLKDILKMIHPFIPFVTEKLYLEIANEKTIMLAPWPVSGPICLKSIQHFNAIQDTITKVRNLRSEYQVAPSKTIEMHLVIDDQEVYEVLVDQYEVFKRFLFAEPLFIEQSLSTNQETILLVGQYIQTHLLKTDLIDTEKEKDNLLKQKEMLENEIARSEKMLNNHAFVSKAPAQKLELEKEKYQNYLKQYETVINKLKDHV
jgi:valyl-tRNA synthetase